MTIKVSLDQTAKNPAKCFNFDQSLLKQHNMPSSRICSILFIINPLNACTWVRVIFLKFIKYSIKIC